MNAERLIAFTQALVRQRSLTGEGSINPSWRSFASASRSSAQSFSGPRSQSPTGMPKPVLGRSTISRGTYL